MTQLGRNDLCHCGSGKKYKKCCLEKDKNKDLTETVLGEQSEKTPANPYPHLLSYEEINQFTTDQIISKLKVLGIPFSEEDFLQDVEQMNAAEEISENWFKKYDLQLTGRAVDFPWFAATILWERLAPDEKTSTEQMINMLYDGIEHLEADNPVAGCNHWLELWETIKHKKTPSMKDLTELEKTYRSAFFVSNFVQDLEFELHNAGVRDPAYFEKRITYCREFCTLFPNEEELMIHNMRRAIADSYTALAKYDEAEAAFEQIAEDFPQNAWSYIAWGDFYYMDKQQHVEKSEELYKKAMAVAANEDDKKDAAQRLEDFYNTK